MVCSKKLHFYDTKNSIFLDELKASYDNLELTYFTYNAFIQGGNIMAEFSVTLAIASFMILIYFIGLFLSDSSSKSSY